VKIRTVCCGTLKEWPLILLRKKFRGSEDWFSSDNACLGEASAKTGLPRRSLGEGGSSEEMNKISVSVCVRLWQKKYILAFYTKSL